MIMGFIDQMRAEGHAVESVCRRTSWTVEPGTPATS